MTELERLRKENLENLNQLNDKLNEVIQKEITTINNIISNVETVEQDLNTNPKLSTLSKDYLTIQIYNLISLLNRFVKTTLKNSSVNTELNNEYNLVLEKAKVLINKYK